MLILVEKDTEPTVLEYAVEGVPVDITTGYAFTLKIGYPDGTLAVVGTPYMGTVTENGITRPAALIRYPWAADDLKPGDFDGEILVANTVANTEKTLKTEKIKILKRL